MNTDEDNVIVYDPMFLYIIIVIGFMNVCLCAYYLWWLKNYGSK